MRRILVGLLLLTSALLAAPAPSSASDSTQATAPETAFKCDSGRYHCWRVTDHLKDVFAVGYKDGLENAKSTPATLQCETTTQITRNYSISATLSGEVKAGIFASIKAETTASLSKSISSGLRITISTSVRPWRNMICERGVAIEKFRVQYCNTSSHGMDCRLITVAAPASAKWRFRDYYIPHG